MSPFANPSQRQISIGLVVLRLAVGAIFVAHGAQKLFIYGFDGVTGAFGQMGIPGAAIVAPLVALLEFFGGLALIAGLLTRPVALGLAVNMLGAIAFVHARNGFFLPDGAEFVTALLGASALLTLAGAGGYSVDALIAGSEAPREAESTPMPTKRAA